LHLRFNVDLSLNEVCATQSSISAISHDENDCQTINLVCSEVACGGFMCGNLDYTWKERIKLIGSGIFVLKWLPMTTPSNMLLIKNYY